QIVRLSELVNRWRSGASTRNQVAITFDDSYAGVFVHALPILRDLDIPATVFVASDHATLGASYWWDDVERSRVASGNREWTQVLDTVGLSGVDRTDANTTDRIRNRLLVQFAGRWPAALKAGG